MMGLQRGERKYVIALISIRQISPGAKQGQKAPVVLRESLQIARLRRSISRLGLETGKCGFQRFAGRLCAVLWDPCQTRRSDHKEQESDCDRALEHSPPEDRAVPAHNIPLFYIYAVRITAAGEKTKEIAGIAEIESKNLTTEARRHGENRIRFNAE